MKEISMLGEILQVPRNRPSDAPNIIPNPPTLPPANKVVPRVSNTYFLVILHLKTMMFVRIPMPQPPIFDFDLMMSFQAANSLPYQWGPPPSIVLRRKPLDVVTLLYLTFFYITIGHESTY